MVDLSGNGNDAVTVTAPDFNTAIGWTFDSANSEYLTTSVVLNNYSTHTSFIISYDADNGGYALGSYSTSSNRYGTHNHASNAGIYIANGNLVYSALIGAMDDYHVIGTRNEDGYIDGVVVADSHFVGGDRNNIYPFYIGARNYRDDHIDAVFSGKIRAIAAYNLEITSAQVIAVTKAMNAL